MNILDIILTGLQEANFFWLIIPIFFIGIITDKYQEEVKTTIGSAMSNGALVIFSAFSWVEIIITRVDIYPVEFIFSQLLFSFFIMIYGFAIIISSFRTREFAKKYGRIRVITFMLVFFTLMIYSPILYNYTSIVAFVLIFPFYYAFITELIKIMPSAKEDYQIIPQKESVSKKHQSIYITLQKKIHEYLK